MQAKRAFRDRPDAEVEVLDALVERPEDGMSVLEIRAAVDADIDTLEGALSELKSDDLIRVDSEDDRTRIKPADRVVPDPEDEESEVGIVEALRRKFGL
jgi:predicted transcriptional regulator